MKKVAAVLLILALSGCSMAQMREEFIGYNISDIKNSKTKQTQQYDLTSEECMAGIRAVLKDAQAIARESKDQKSVVADNFQNVFKSCIDTTQVGILITPWENNKSQVDVASGNVDLAAFVSRKISERLKPGKESQTPKEEQVNLK